MRAKSPALLMACWCALVLLSGAAGAAEATAATLKPLPLLGQRLFFDKNLSEPTGQSCASCHSPRVGFTGADQAVNKAGSVYAGAAMGSWFGNRRPPTAAYAGGSPKLTNDAGEFTGGMFYDGRANGWTLGDPLAEQAGGPFLNVWEQNMADKAAVVGRVREGSYAALFRQVWGASAFDDTDKAYDRIGRSIAAFERSRDVSRYTSLYDTYLKSGGGLTAQQRQGLSLFKNKAGCAHCHVARRDRAAGGVVLTDYTYANLGIPRNPDNPFYAELGLNPLGANWVDPGLGDFLASTAGKTPDYSSYAAENTGKFKVPTLRNVDKRPSAAFVKAYGHNGYFKSLRQLVHFMNTRDVPGAGWKGRPWPAPEYAANLETGHNMGHLGLTAAQEKALVTFLAALTDR